MSSEMTPIDVFLDFYGFELEKSVSGFFKFHVKRSPFSLLFWQTQDPIPASAFTSKEDAEKTMLESRKFNVIEEDGYQRWPTAIENVFYGCKSLEEALVRKDLAKDINSFQVL